MNNDLPVLHERTWWRLLGRRAWQRVRPSAPASPTRSEPIRLGIIGVGNVAQWQHLPWLRKSPALFRVSAVFDAHQARANDIASEFGARVTASTADLVNDPRVDAVLICTPPEFHASMAAAALTARKHVLCEKPLAQTIDEADLLWKCARRAHGLVAMVNFTLRCRPEFQLAAEIIRQGVLGEIYQVWGSISQGKWFTASGRPSGERADATPWKYDRGGVLLDLAPHLIDLVRWWLGDIRAVQAWTKRLRGKDEPTVAACGVNLAMQSGAMVQLLCSRLATGAKEQTLLEMNGAQGSLRFTARGLELWTRDTSRWRSLMVPSGTAQPLELFARTICRLPADIPTFWDGYKANEALAAIEQSAETGAQIVLPFGVTAPQARERDVSMQTGASDAEFDVPALARKA